MATFVSTTLTKRTGATTTVFVPGIKSDNLGYLFEGATLAGYGRSFTMEAGRNGVGRKTTLVFRVPQLSDDGLSVLRFVQAKLELIVPDGVPSDTVNDIVGYVNAATATGLTSLNSLLVNGEGVY